MQPTPQELYDLTELLCSNSLPVAGPLEDPCLIWTGNCVPAGYGRARWRGTLWYTHRLAFICLTSRLPEKHILHHCDNPACCNSGHLFEGTQKDNAEDRTNKGRGRKDLTIAQYTEIHCTKINRRA